MTIPYSLPRSYGAGFTEEEKGKKDVASQVPALLLLPMGTGYSFKGLEEKSFWMEDKQNEWMLLMNPTWDKLSNMC